MNKIIQYILNFFQKGKGKGLVESPLDLRDFLLENIEKIFGKDKNPIPEQYQIPYILPINNQGNYPRCVGESARVIKVEKERREQNDVDFDPQWIYNECKKIDGIPNTQGTYFRSAFKVLKNKGALAMGDPNYDKYRIGAYTKVNIDFEDIKRAIYEHGVVLAGFKMSNDGWTTANTRKPFNGEIVFGHAVPLVGYTKDKIIFQNSWGDKWGDNGYGNFGRDNMPFEAWCVLTDLPNDWKDITSQGEKPQYNFVYDLWFNMSPNQHVISLQDCLKYEGCMDKSIKSVGQFGPKTLEAVKVFQNRYGIYPVKGFVGPKTREKLNQLFN